MFSLWQRREPKRQVYDVPVEAEAHTLMSGRGNIEYIEVLTLIVLLGLTILVIFWR